VIRQGAAVRGERGEVGCVGCTEVSHSGAGMAGFGWHCWAGAARTVHLGCCTSLFTGSGWEQLLWLSTVGCAVSGCAA